jgi:hypothetical protein
MAANKKKAKKRGRTDAAAKGRQRGRRGDGEKAAPHTATSSQQM